MFKRYLIGAGVCVAVLAGIWGYGQHKYSRGYTTAQTDHQLELAQLNDAARQKELAIQKNYEEMINDAHQQKQVAEAAAADLDAVNSRLRKTISNQAAKLKSASATASAHVSLASCWRVLDESVTEYGKVAKDADGLVERLRAGQGWARAIEQAK
ncbi:MAG: DUF2514 family protein [Advenella sp.]|uniref:DUF2514 family protein n=1 Tax=Advenella sp. TaxID=1872388 RepID=UPI00258EAA84|nr:DUF2514 family protein [Advenella sp.]MDD3757720.1 DUF2514 family protein [Advenella sp.]